MRPQAPDAGAVGSSNRARGGVGALVHPGRGPVDTGAVGGCSGNVAVLELLATRGVDLSAKDLALHWEPAGALAVARCLDGAGPGDYHV